MKTKHIISAFVLALLLIPGAAFVAKAETDSSDDATLEELVEKLTDRVDDLEEDLEKAEARITELEGIVKSGKYASTTPKMKHDGKDKKWGGDQYEKGDKTLCHKGQTLHVSGWAAAAHVIHHQGDKLGACAVSDDDEEEGEDDDDEDDDDDDD